ncbi:MAG: hypothetical protein RR772_03225, partial [Gordonibacter sp.]
NVHVIDWYGASEGREDLFDGDGTHLTEEGARFYIELVYAAIGSQLPAHPEDATPPAEEPAAEAPAVQPEGEAQTEA